jgi:DNA-directed RNA polymerase specialized sigma24 family protein
LQATAVVHEAFLRLIQANVALQDRGHFFALASRLMRRVLVDHAKSRSRIKRNSGARELAAEGTTETSPPIDFDVVALDDALEGLHQIAAAVNTSAATVHRDIRLARAWLLNEIGGARPA